MANLIVRKVDKRIVEALEARAAKQGVSAEVEHRRILAKALGRPRKKSFASVLASMPNAGKDEDFRRIEK